MKHLRVMLEYFHPWTNSAGLYWAREQGWYRQAGLDLELVVPDPDRGDTLAHLDRGEVDFGLFPTNRLFVRRENGSSVVGIAAINHRGMETIQTLRSTGIQRPADLAGRRVALNPTPRGLAMVKHLVRADGGNPESIVWVDAGTRELTPEALAAGQAEATFGSYWAWEVQFDSTVPPDERVVWPVDEIGAPPYHSYLLGARQGLLGSAPGLVRDFLAATDAGYRAVAEDPLAALPVYERIIPYFPTRVLERSLPLIAPTWLHNGAWGIQREELMKPYACWLADEGILHTQDRWQEAFTNTFLPAAGGAA